MKSVCAMGRMCARIVPLVAAAALSACSISEQDAPPLTGPSGFAQAVTLFAAPDQLPRDGSSQSAVTVSVRNESGQPVSGQRLTLAATGGTLSSTDVTTGTDGRVTVTLTAPPAGAVGNSVEVFATPVGDNAFGAVTRRVSIALTGVSNSTAPNPQFTITPEAPGVGETATFDASTTTDEGGPCGDVCTYSWSFGDGATASGRIVTHVFRAAGSHTVSLTVRDAAGTTVSVQRVLTIAVVPAPSVTVVVSPATPLAGQSATLAATATPAAGHSITRYEWNFGDGASQTTTSPTVNHTYATGGTYVVTVTATDDLGQTGSTSLQISVSTGGPTATIVVSPTSPAVGQRAILSATNPVVAGGATIVSYEWNFGDTAISGGGSASGQSVEHIYTTPNTFVVRLTITDSAGRVGVVTSEVSVTDPGAGN